MSSKDIKGGGQKGGIITETGKALFPFWGKAGPVTRFWIILAVGTVVVLAIWKPWKKEMPTSQQTVTQPGSNNSSVQAGRDVTSQTARNIYNVNSNKVDGGILTVGQSGGTNIINNYKGPSPTVTFINFEASNLPQSNLFVTELHCKLLDPPLDHRAVQFKFNPSLPEPRTGRAEHSLSGTISDGLRWHPYIDYTLTEYLPSPVDWSKIQITAIGVDPKPGAQ